MSAECVEISWEKFAQSVHTHASRIDFIEYSSSLCLKPRACCVFFNLVDKTVDEIIDSAELSAIRQMLIEPAPLFLVCILKRKVSVTDSIAILKGDVAQTQFWGIIRFCSQTLFKSLIRVLETRVGREISHRECSNGKLYLVVALHELHGLRVPNPGISGGCHGNHKGVRVRRIVEKRRRQIARLLHHVCRFSGNAPGDDARQVYQIKIDAQRRVQLDDDAIVRHAHQAPVRRRN